MGSQHKSLGQHLLSRALLAEHVLALMVAQIVTRSLHVQKHAVGASNVHQVDLARLPLRGQQGAGCDQLDGVAQSGLCANLGEEVQCLLGELHVLFFTASFEDLPDFVLGVVLGLDDEETVEQVERHAVGTA